MRYCLVILAIAACDLRPAPPKVEPPPAKPDTAAVAPAGDGGAAAPGDAAAVAVLDAADIAVRPAGDAMVVTDECMAISDHIATVLINASTDAAQKAALTQDRVKVVRRSAEACTRDNWNEASRTCFQRAATLDELQICGNGLKAP